MMLSTPVAHSSIKWIADIYFLQKVLYLRLPKKRQIFSQIFGRWDLGLSGHHFLE